MVKNESVNPEQDPEEEYVELNQFVSFEQPGDCAEGELIGQTEIELLDGKVIAQFALLSDTGVVSFNESFQLSILRRIPLGTHVRVVYTGEGPRNPRGNPVKIFKVSCKKRDFAAFAAQMARPQIPAAPAAPAVPSPAAAFEEAGAEGFADPFAEA